jgi:hypothetical protein
MTAFGDNEIEKIKSREEDWLRIPEELFYSTDGAIPERFDEGDPSLPFK